MSPAKSQRSKHNHEGQAPFDLDLDGAYEAVMREVKHDEVPDVLRHQDFAECWPEVKAQVIEALKDSSYTPTPAALVEVPKSTLATRPIAVLQMADRIVYEAIVERLGPPIDRVLSSEVFSARLKKRKTGRMRPERQVKAWVEFEKEGRRLSDDYEEVCLLTTDITSYFEFVDPGRLIKSLKTVPGIDEEVVDLLALLLRGVASDATNVHGIPQGPEVSSILGNFYLLPLDAILKKLNVRWIRFQDDIKVFADEPHTLRLVMRELMPEVRGRHLNLSTAKTNILEGDAVLEHFEDTRKDAIQYGLDTGDPNIGDDLRDLFDEATRGESINERDVRFAVHRFGKLDDDYAVGWILEHLDSVPYLASLLVRYLSNHFHALPEIEDKTREFLDDPQRNLSPVVEMHLIRMFARAPEVSDETHALLWTTLKDQNKADYVREWAARAIGRHIPDDSSRLGDVDLLKSLFKLTTDTGLRRALLVAVYEAESVDKSWLNAASADSLLRHTCDYLKKTPELIPP